MGYNTHKLFRPVLVSLIMVLLTVSLVRGDRGRPKIDPVRNTLVADNGYLLRGCHSHFHSWAFSGAYGKLSWWTDLRDKANLNVVRLMAYLGEWPKSNEVVDEAALVARLDVAVNKAAEAGMYIIIDNHSNCCGWYKLSTFQRFWDLVAPRYKDRTHVIYEAQNEPFYKRATGEQVKAMYDYIRPKAPNTHIILHSIAKIDDIETRAVKESGIDYANANASIGFHSYLWDGQPDTDPDVTWWYNYLYEMMDYGPVVMTETTDEAGTSRPDLVVRKLEEMKISWQWLAGYDFGTHTGFDPTEPMFAVHWPADPGCVGGTVPPPPTDKTPPTLVDAAAIGDPGKVTVVFSEAVDAASAGTAGNYVVNNGISVTSAGLESDRKTVALSVSTLTAGVTYSLNVSSVKDLAGNTIAANTTAAFQYTAGWTDDFSDGNYTAGPAWTVGEGSWSVSSGQLQNSGTGRTSVYGGQTSWTDIVFTSSVTPVTAGCDVAVLFRVQDVRNYLLFTLMGTEGKGALYAVQNGSYSSRLADGNGSVTFSSNTTYTLKVELTGSAVKISADGKTVLSTTNTLWSAGAVGFGSNASQGRFDNVAVTLPAGQTLIGQSGQPLRPDLSIMGAGFYSLDGRRIIKPLQTGVYLEILEYNGVTTVKRFVKVGR